MAKRKTDVYPNRVVHRVVSSASDTLTFTQIRFGTGLFGGVALIIHKLEYHVARASARKLLEITDNLEVAMTNRDDLANLEPTNLNVLDRVELIPMQVGSVVSLNMLIMPIIKTFNEMPGGGMIIPTNPLYLGLSTGGFGATATVDLVMYYTFKQMTDADYIELVQGMLPANI